MRLRHLGDVHYDAGRRELAEPLYEKALALYRAHDTPPLELANATLDAAERLWEEAHQLYLVTNVPSGVAETAARLARIRRP